MALSPDGTELAVAVQPDANDSGQAPESLVLYSLATGAVLRTWTGPNGTISTPGEWFRVDSVNTTLSWLTGGHTLVFSDESAVRTLDTTGQGQNLISDSQLVWSPETSAGTRLAISFPVRENRLSSTAARPWSAAPRECQPRAPPDQRML